MVAAVAAGGCAAVRIGPDGAWTACGNVAHVTAWVAGAARRHPGSWYRYRVGLQGPVGRCPVGPVPYPAAAGPDGPVIHSFQPDLVYHVQIGRDLASMPYFVDGQLDVVNRHG